MALGAAIGVRTLLREMRQQQGRDDELSVLRLRYERLFKSKGENVVVGVHHGVCGGCHMKLPAQILVMCQAHQELVSCTNCGRILYYTRDMALAGAE
jgi:predicted  nucleic acid-binding Zn-ribbon protein